MDTAYSINGVPVRLPYERWYHITESHDDMASFYHEVLEAVERPDMVLRGNAGTLKATKNLARSRWLVVVYKESSKADGFVLTAYFTSTRPKGECIWRQS
jgi:hypothetical protein